MATNTNNEAEYLVIGDETGNYFAIPRDVVETYRATPEQLGQIGAEGSDVSGYSMYQSFTNQQIADQYQAERRREAAQARMLKSSDWNESDAVGQPTAGNPAESLGGLLTGMWRRLSSARQSTSHP